MNYLYQLLETIKGTDLSEEKNVLNHATTESTSELNITDRNHTVTLSRSLNRGRGECIIKGGNNTEVPCIFPFRWHGKIYHSCVYKKGGSWCSTKVDNDGEHIDKFWGKCPRKCKVDKSLKHQKGRSLAGKQITTKLNSYLKNLANLPLNRILIMVEYILI